MSELRWSDQDVPLLDEARALLDGAPRTYGHVIVDEAQDLSPMQLLAISRRAIDGSLTILGDVAQATGPVVYRRWQELEPYLPDEAELSIEEQRRAKGLEFDQVVVVEPAAIADNGDRGLRELYVALTRPTKTLVVVHARPLPEPLGS